MSVSAFLLLAVTLPSAIQVRSVESVSCPLDVRLRGALERLRPGLEVLAAPQPTANDDLFLVVENATSSCTPAHLAFWGEIGVSRRFFEGRWRVDHSLTARNDRQSALLAQCRARDEAAWKELYTQHFGFVFRTARRLGVPAEQAEDVVHEVFVVAFHKLDDFTHGRITTWLYRICANIASDLHRRRKVRRAFCALEVRVGARPPETPERAAERSSARGAVERILSRMSRRRERSSPCSSSRACRARRSRSESGVRWTRYGPGCTMPASSSSRSPAISTTWERR